ncbi:MAG: AmmeMemoRadiSam system radical SAM enzyme [Clostridiales bacterium]|jgi:pyruvate formate lyase activating enzyme|nr:AmmeMemoRadiSam system radical SAM enzyme [Clostridiales bacterium]
MKTECNICPHRCKLSEGQLGLCNGRICKDGKVISENYGRITSMALDPIEKKPLYHFNPGSKILSVGSYGCNLRCPWCQNHDISMVKGTEIDYGNTTAEALFNQAYELKGRGNIGIAYTYNEPLIGYEFVKDTSTLAKEKGLKNVVVTGGFICEEPLRELLPLVDAFNIDLKGFSQDFYKKLKGDLETVKNTIATTAAHCHVEVTTLIIPGDNDSEEEMEALSSWLSSVRPDIPLHVSRFFPRWRMQDKEATPIETVYRLAEIARRKLKHVYEGNC